MDTGAAEQRSPIRTRSDVDARPVKRESSTVPDAQPSAYLMRMQLPAENEAGELARELEQRGADVERSGAIVTSVWPASDADHLDHWDEFSFPELRFFLRAWAGANAGRQLVVLEERPVCLTAT
jgi:hypothetical protein